MPLAATTWTTAAGGVVALRQAGAGRLPVTAAGTTPRGSLFIEGTLGLFPFSLDCQAGAARPNGSGAIPQEPPPVATVGVGTPAPPPAPPLAPPPATSAGQADGVVILSPGLRLAGGAVRVAVRCASTAPCRGVVAVRSDTPVRSGSRRAVLALGRVAVSLAAGRAASLLVRLTPRALASASTRRALAVRVLATPADGDPVARRLVLRLR